MKVQVEGIICNWTDEIPNIIVRIINAISIAENKEELQTALLQISQETELDKFFVYWKSHTNLTHPGKYFRPSKVKIMRPTSPK